MKNKKVEITVSNHTIMRLVVVAIASFLLFRLFLALSKPITLVLIAFFLALALNPAVSWVAKLTRRKNRALATAISFITVLFLLVSFFSLVIPPLIRQTADFVGEIPATVNNLRNQDTPVGRAIQKYHLSQQIDDFSRDFGSKVKPQPILDTAGRVGNVVVSTFAVLAMTFMMLNEGPMWVKRFIEFIPKNKREHRTALLLSMYRMVTGYVNGQLIMSALAASLLLVMLLITSSVLGVSINAVALAGIMAIFGLIPMIGVPIGAAIVILACMLNSLSLAIIIAIYFLVYQQLENLTIQPYIQSKQNELTPLVVFISALVGVYYGGILGALFAIPVAGCIRILIIDWSLRRGHKLSVTD